MLFLNGQPKVSFGEGPLSRVPTEYSYPVAQSPEAGRAGAQAMLTVDGPRPVDSAAITLAEEFGINVSVEDPAYLFRDDVKDARTANPSRRVLVPRGGQLAVNFPVRADGFPEDVPGLIEILVRQANAKFPFAYRIDSIGNSYAIVPTRMRDAVGNVIETTPLLDRRVNIPLGTRTIAETASVMTAALSAQTGLRVSCCQAVIAGVPWGRSQIAFMAPDESARSVLTRLTEAELQGRPNHYYWLERCDPLPSNWGHDDLVQGVGSIWNRRFSPQQTPTRAILRRSWRTKRSAAPPEASRMIDPGSGTSLMKW